MDPCQLHLLEPGVPQPAPIRYFASDPFETWLALLSSGLFVIAMPSTSPGGGVPLEKRCSVPGLFGDLAPLFSDVSWLQPVALLLNQLLHRGTLAS